MRALWIAAATLALLAGCDDFPKDSAGSLARIHDGEVRVGVADNPPWVVFEGDRVTGVEPALIQAWADGLGAQVHWVRGAEAELVEALNRRELDLMAAGLSHRTPHASRLGLTQPYLETAIRVGAPAGEPVPDDLAGMQVAVPPGRPALVGRLRDEKAVPAEGNGQGARAAKLVAGYDVELEAEGLSPGGRRLHTEKRVMAVMPGESALLLDLDRFLLGVDEAALRRRAAEEARR
ncbi:MAG TPA: transporter substrate-binding domain-containing protein [Azospirillaceae bacterium]|nr:transporter substrate-binding domain-containing protein [Azospirillaceae bacterium]